MTRGFTALHPIVLFVYYILSMLFLMYVESIGILVIIFFMLVLHNILLDRATQLKTWGKAFIIMGAFIIILTPMFNHIGTTILFHLFHRPIMLDAVLYGIMLAFTLINIMLLFITLNGTLTNKKILILFGKFFPKWALLTVLSLRFIPLLRGRLQEIDEVQSFKRNSESKPSFLMKIREGMAQIRILLSWSLESAIQTADSMDARGYGLGKRSKYHRYYMKRIDWVLVSCFILLFIYFIRVINLEDVSRAMHIILHLSVICLFCLPLLMEGKEIVKWRLYHSKS